MIDSTLKLIWLGTVVTIKGCVARTLTFRCVLAFSAPQLLGFARGFSDVRIYLTQIAP